MNRQDSKSKSQTEANSPDKKDDNQNKSVEDKFFTSRHISGRVSEKVETAQREVENLFKLGFITKDIEHIEKSDENNAFSYMNSKRTVPDQRVANLTYNLLTFKHCSQLLEEAKMDLELKNQADHTYFDELQYLLTHYHVILPPQDDQTQYVKYRHH